MTPIVVAASAFLLISTGILIGSLIRSRLPEHHVTGDSKDTIKLATALVGTLSALVLALMFAATRSSFETTSAAVSRLAADLTELDEVLEDYGPQARPIRQQLRADIDPLIRSIWYPEGGGERRAAGSGRVGARALTMIRHLQPSDATQSSVHARALQLVNDISQARLSLFARPPDSVSGPFMVVLVIWLVFLFSTFSMITPPNPTLAVVLGISILSASAALYLILELGLPFNGLMQVSDASLRAALPPL
ncbi:hypothetical protein [Reyranella sp.]|uniref:bestrophin-like domain n=1 Tax=Reyranella sp. TaxID=1929291 RepID=UPI003BA86649